MCSIFGIVYRKEDRLITRNGVYTPALLASSLHQSLMTSGTDLAWKIGSPVFFCMDAVHHLNNIPKINFDSFNKSRSPRPPPFHILSVISNRGPSFLPLFTTSTVISAACIAHTVMDTVLLNELFFKHMLI